MAAKVAKQLTEFMAKVHGMMGQKRTDTALSGSQQDESNEEPRANSFLSHNRGVSKRSLVSLGHKSKSDHDS